MSSLDTRAVDRDSLFLVADLVFEDRPEPVKAKVRNLSVAGMMVSVASTKEGDVFTRTGARVTAELRNIGSVSGTVVWCSAPRCGIAFDREIDPKLARVEVYGGAKAAPVYARAALTPGRPASSDGRKRPT